jgi:putative CocE/NonD family hydrolase
MNLAEGQIRTTYRNGNQKLEPMQPGKAYELTIDLGSTSNLFEKGHRIRLDVSSSSFPRLEPNPNVGGWGMWDKRVTAINSLYNGTEYRSYVELTVLPE